jgi:hypothetical protein
MSLLVAHRLLIAIAILFCAGLALHDVASGDGDPWTLLRGAASATGAILLALYLRWFVRGHASPTAAVALRHGGRRDN